METAATAASASPLTYRDATDADVEALVVLVESAYRGEASRTGWTTEADILDGQRTDAEGVLEVIKAPDSRLLAEREGVLVACCHLEHRGRAPTSACSRSARGCRAAASAGRCWPRRSGRRGRAGESPRCR